jgi:hypothetical protein
MVLAEGESRLLFGTIIQRNEKMLEHRDGPFVDIEEVVTPGALGFDPGITYTMIESPAYFEAYRPVLEALQSFSDDPTGLPFSQVLLSGGGVSVAPPAYLIRGGQRLELDGIYPGAATWGLDDEAWPLGDPLLNESQLRAVKMALRNRVALIQGPPG